MFSFLIRSSYLKVVISFEPFNSTSAVSLLNCSTVFSFEWALTHRSFPRILPDSSNFPGAIPKFFSKCDVRMDSISHMLFQDRFQIIFIVGSTPSLFILPEYLSNFGGVSRRLSKTEEEFFL